MVITNVFGVLSDGAITEIELKANGGMRLKIKRKQPDDAFSSEHVEALSMDENVLEDALSEIS